MTKNIEKLQKKLEDNLVKEAKDDKEAIKLADEQVELMEQIVLEQEKQKAKQEK